MGSGVLDLWTHKGNRAAELEGAVSLSAQNIFPNGMMLCTCPVIQGQVYVLWCKKRLRKCPDHFKETLVQFSAYRYSATLLAPLRPMSQFCPYLTHLLCLYSLFQVSMFSNWVLKTTSIPSCRQGGGSNEFFPMNCSQAPKPSKCLSQNYLDTFYMSIIFKIQLFLF